MRLQELLTLAFAPLGGALGVGSLALMGPWSPLALDEATGRLAAGDTRGAIAAYERAGVGWHTPELRAEAWARSAYLRRAEGDPRGAVRALERAVDLEPAQTDRIALLEELGALYEGPLGDPRACAEAFEHAAAELGSAADERAAARCWRRAENDAAAELALERAASG